MGSSCLAVTRLIKKEESMNTALARRNNPGLLGRSVFDDIFDSFFTDVPTYVQKSTQGYPVADIYSDAEGNTVMEFALAGFTRDQLKGD